MHLQGEKKEREKKVKGNPKYFPSLYRTQKDQMYLYQSVPQLCIFKLILYFRKTIFFTVTSSS